MRNEKMTTPLLLALVLLICLWAGGCTCPENEAASCGDELVMKSYTVAPEYGDELREILDDMFYHGGDADPVGSVDIFREGLVVVAAPASMHDGIEEIITFLAGSEPTPPPTVRITYWAVQGKVAGESVWQGRLDHLQEALETIVAVDGPMAFTLLEKIALSSLSGSRARTDGPYFSIQQSATARNGAVHARLDIGKGPVLRLRTNVRLEPGQLMVLEQAGFTAMVDGAPEMADRSTYLILQAQVVSPDGR